jgi:hypothetical protein
VKLPPSKPYQIPLTSLLSRNVENLLAASKNMGTTHITNGAYRVHATEWAVGAAAGATAARSIRQHLPVKTLAADPRQLLALQRELIADGQPLVWFNDVPVDAPYFSDVQLAALLGLVALDPDSLSFHPDAPVSAEEVAHALGQLGLREAPGTMTRAAFAQWIVSRALPATPAR